MAQPFLGDIVHPLKRDKVIRNTSTPCLMMKERSAIEEIPFAVIGAIGMRKYVFVRDMHRQTYKKERLDKIHEVFVGCSIVMRFEDARKKLRQTQHHLNIDVITSMGSY